MPQPDLTRQLFWRGVIAIPLLLTLWGFWLKPFTAWMIQPWVQLGIQLFLSDTVFQVKSAGGKWLFYTTLMAVENPLHPQIFTLDGTRFTLSFPLFWALMLATPLTWSRRFIELVWGTLIIWALVTVFLLVYVHFLFALTINQQAIVGHQPPDTGYLLAPATGPVAYYLLALGRQVSLLVGPIFAPVVVWMVFHRDLMITIMGRGAGWLRGRAGKPS